MTSTEELALLLEQALLNRSAEPAFYRALLEAHVYVHAPAHDDSRKLRLIQFIRPDGQTVLPFFSEEAQAQAAWAPGIRILRYTGRELLEGTRGATLMLNPNAANCTLYPEEIAALLDEGVVAMVEKFSSDESAKAISTVECPPAWLLDRLHAVFANLPAVEAAYLAEFRPMDNLDQMTLVIVLAVSPVETERAARATITAIQAECEQRRCNVDLTAFDPVYGPPLWITNEGLEAFYQRQPGDGHDHANRARAKFSSNRRPSERATSK